MSLKKVLIFTKSPGIAARAPSKEQWHAVSVVGGPGACAAVKSWAPNGSWPTRLADSRFPSARRLGAANAFIATSRIVAQVRVVRGSAMSC